MSENGDITDQIVAVVVIVLLVATLGVSAFSILGGSSLVTNYSQAFNASSGFTGAGRVFLSNSELKTGTLFISNATFAAAVTTDYTVDETSGIITIVPLTASGRLLNGTSYTATYQKDSVPSIVKTLALTVIAIIGAIAILIILTRFIR